ncbi:MAG TPA: Ig-like domain-containing protein [Pyrinomonadaceae bacterium]|nr:Ig-like domain-containing protein [Pyrinomonadaceae bacterium]
MLKKNLRTGLLFAAALLLLTTTARAQYLMENLNRGVVAIRQNATDVYVGWRLFGTDPSGVSFNLYRSTGGGPAIRLNGAPISDSTNFVDAGADLSQPNAYFVRPVVGGVERAPSDSFTLPANAAVQQYLNVPLQIPAGGTTPDGVNYTYTANDASVGDVDGDGEYEIILKWDPTNSKDNSQSGYTGNVYLDAYKLNGTRLWRINLGRNIRAGAHYTQFMVYDLDGDGKAELACKTADATVDGVGTVIGSASADHRNSSGYVLSGPEFLTVFNGLTGAAMATVNYNPGRGTVSSWGDSYGNRVDRFLAGVAYLDGKRPSLVMARGYYTRAYVAAWDFRDGQLTNRWNFDTGHTGTANQYSAWRGQGSHALTIGDVDGDGKDEITYGAAAIDDDGTGLYSTGLGHGDALHMSDMDPDRPGQEVYMVHEEPASYGPYGSEFRDAKTGQLIFGVSGEGADVGRGVAMDIDPRYRGYELYSSRGGIWSSTGVQISTSAPSPKNFAVWWDADLLREFEDGTTISKWNWTTRTASTLLSPVGVASNNSTKATPSLLGDILGDWREEVIWRTSDNTALRIYTTTIPATNRIYTLMHDHQYRVAVAWQNTAYNQPPHPSFYLGDGMNGVPKANIVTSLGARIAAITKVTDDTGVSSTDEITSDATLVLSGTAGANNTVALTLAGVGQIGTATADAAGDWSFDYTASALSEGTHTFNATASDEEGGETPESEPFVVTVDATAPAAPSINSVGGGSLVFKGTAEPGTAVTVTRAGAGIVGTAGADQGGAWAVTYAGTLPQGLHTFTATAADTAGNVSPASAEYTVDTGLMTPAITNIVSDTGALSNDRVTSDTTLVINGTSAAGHTVTVSRADAGVVGAAIADGSGNWTFDYTNTVLAPGTYTFNAKATDNSNHDSLSSPDFVVTVEETPPAVVSINRQTPSGATINGGSVVFRVTFSEQVNGVDASDFQLATTGSTTGAVAGAATVTNTTFDVTVNAISGTGTLRLDLKASGTGIVDVAGNQIAGGYTAGQSYTVSNNVSGVWSQLASGGFWSGGGNWQNGAVANGAGNTADFSALNISGTNLVRLDSPRALGNLVFGDTGTTTAGSWVLDSNGDPLNALTLSVASGQPTVTVNALAANASATIAAPVASSAGLTKAGAGTLILTGANNYGGTSTVGAGTLRLGAGGQLTSSGIVNVGTSSVAANLFLDAGTANLNGGVRTSNFDGSVIRVNGGTLTTPSVTVQRSSGTSISYSTGFVFAGGTATVGAIGIGTNNSNGAMSVEGGSLTATGAVTVGNQATAGRGGGMRVTGGAFRAEDTANGIVLSRTNGSNANNVSEARFTGGTSTVEKFTLGFDSTVTAGSATIVVDGGALYMGGGGIVKKGAGGLVTNINLTSGTLGAAEDWSTALPMTLTSGGNIQLKAADASNLPQNITLSGALTGTGGFTKTGTGTLVLSGPNTYTGATTVNAGTLRINGQVAAGGAFNVNSGATLSGSGTVNRAVTLGSGASAAPEGAAPIATLGAASLNWNGGATMDFDLGATSDRLALTGAFTKAGAGSYEFAFNPAADLAPGTVYTLVTFGSTNFGASDFTYSGLPAELKGKFAVEAGALKFTVLDNVAPTLHAPADTTLEATSAAGAVANYTATAEDNIEGPLAVSFSIPSGSAFALGTTQVTATATDSAGNTATATFNVIVRDTTAPTVACPADIVVAAAPGASTAAVNFNPTAGDTVSAVTVTGSPASGSAFAVGTTTVNVTAKDAAGNTSTCSFTVTVKSSPTIAVAPASVQYSDAVMLQAAVNAAQFPGQPLAGSVEFFVNGSPVGQSALTNGVATLAFTANAPAGSYAVTAKFTSASPAYLDATSAASTLTVSRENAAPAYTGDAALLTAGPNVNTATVRLAARLTPEADGANFVGDIAKATVTFELFKSNNSSATPDLVVSGVAVDANGDAAATVNNLAAEIYTVSVKVDGANQFWTANPVGDGVLAIAVPSDELHSSGGGWVADASSANGRANFGFSVKAGKRGEQVRGNFTLVFRGPDGFNYVVKGNSWQDGYLQFAAEPGVTPTVYTRSEMKGKCSVQKVDPATGQTVESRGNYSFEAYTSDGDLLDPRQPDAYAFVVRDGDGAVWHQAGSRAALVTLGGGNITNKAR